MCQSANFVLYGNDVLSANGGSCVDDFVYRLEQGNGSGESPFQDATAVERMDMSGGNLMLQLYEGAAAYQLP